MNDVTNQEILQAINTHASQNDQRAERVDIRLDRIEKSIDKLVISVLSLEQWKQEASQQLSDIRETMNKTFNRLDEFINLMKTQEMELAALRSKYNRLEANVQQLAQHLHIQLQS